VIVRSRLGTVPGFDLEREYEYRQVLSDLVKVLDWCVGYAQELA